MEDILKNITGKKIKCGFFVFFCLKISHYNNKKLDKATGQC